MVQVTIKNVDEQMFAELKAEAVRDRMNVGDALNLAIQRWLMSKKKKKKLSDIKPVSWGPGTEHLSEQIDEVLYG